MKLLAGFTLTCLGLDQYVGFLFNLLFVQESLVPVHFCHPQYCFYFLLYLYVFIASEKIYFGFAGARRAGGLPALCIVQESLGCKCQWLLRGLASSSPRANPPHPRGCQGLTLAL